VRLLAKNLTSNRHYTYCPEKCDRAQEIVAGFTPYGMANARSRSRWLNCKRCHGASAIRSLVLALQCGRFSYGVRNMPYKVERACSSYGRGFAHPMKGDVKEKSFSPPLREMRVW
jgi:hypothetical protein